MLFIRRRHLLLAITIIPPALVIGVIQLLEQPSEILRFFAKILRSVRRRGFSRKIGGLKLLRTIICRFEKKRVEKKLSLEKYDCRKEVQYR